MSATKSQITTQNNSPDSPISTLLPTKSNVKVLSQAENGDLYLKVFLLGKDINGNKWGIHQTTVEDNIRTAIGKPLVIYKDTGEEPDRIRYTPDGPKGEWPRKKGQYNHPPWDPHSIEHSREMQQQHKVGEIERVAKNQQTGDYWGMVKITDPDLKSVLKTNPTLPFYVSPQLWRLNQDETHILKNWEFMHLAIVSQPAFGVRATVQGSCAGDSSSCTRQFMAMNASLMDDSGSPDGSTGKKKPGCGCIFNAMREVSEQTIENEKTDRTIHDIHTEDTSHLRNSSNLKTEERLSDNNNTQNAVSGIPNAATISENVANEGRTQTVEYTTQQQPQQRTVSVEHKTYPNPETRTYRPNANPQANDEGNTNTNAPNGDSKLALIARIEQEKAKRAEALQQLKVLARDNQKLAVDASRYERELDEVKNYMEAQKAATRENGIAEVIYSANLADLVPEDKKEEAIKLALSKGLEPNDVAKFLSPIYEAFDNFMASQKQNGNEQVPQYNAPANASLNQKKSRLTLGASNNSGSTFNASMQKPTASFSELAFERARKLAGMYTPSDNSEVV
jgi:hypothetical protein